MEVKDMKLTDVQERITELRAFEPEGATLEEIQANTVELRALNDREEAIMKAAEERKAQIDKVINMPNPEVIATFNKEKEMEERVFGIESKEYRNAFLKTLQGKELTEVEKREFTLVPNTAGAVVPTETANMIFDNMTKIAPMLNEIQLLRVAGNLRFAVQGVRNAVAAHAEGVAVVPAADTMVTVTLTGFEFMKVIRISATIATMGVNEFEAWIAKIIGEDLAVQIDAQIISGATVTGNIATAQVWADGVNQITYVANVTYANLIALIALLPSAFDANAKFLMNKATFYNQIMGVADAAGNLLAVPDLASPGQYRILGYPVLIDDNAPVGEAFLGDYKQVVGNLAADIKIDRSTESGFLNNSIDFRGTAIFDCDVAQPTAIVKLNV